MSADHPLARACARSHSQTDAVLAAQALGEQVDAQLAALADLAERTSETRAAIHAAADLLGRAEAAVTGGEHPAYWNWIRASRAAIGRHARRLFPEAAEWVGDVSRGPQWTP